MQRREADRTLHASLLNPHYLSEGSINGCIITPEQLLVCVCVLFFKVLCFSRGGNKQCACSQKASILNSPNGFLVRRAILSSVLYASWCSNCYCTSKLIHTYIHKENKGNCRTCVSTGGWWWQLLVYSLKVPPFLHLRFKHVWGIERKKEKKKKERKPNNTIRSSGSFPPSTPPKKRVSPRGGEGAARL